MGAKRSGAQLRRPVRGATRAFAFRLYVSGATPKSSEAIENVKRICEKHIPGQYRLEVIDIYQQPQRAERDQVVAVPTLVKRMPRPVRKLIGTLPETAQLMKTLQLVTTARALDDSAC